MRADALHKTLQQLDQTRGGKSIRRWYRLILWQQSARRGCARFRFDQRLGQRAHPLAQHIAILLFEALANTRREMQEEARAQRFRQDLCSRLRVFPLALPPLRSRQDDIPLLAGHVMVQVSTKRGKEAPRVTHDDGHRLQQDAWPGTIRALQHGLARAVLLSKGDRLRLGRALADAPAVTAPTSRLSGDMPDAVVTHHAGALACAPLSCTPCSALRGASLAREGLPTGSASHRRPSRHASARSRSTRRARLDLPIARCQARYTRSPGPTSWRGGIRGSIRRPGCVLVWRTHPSCTRVERWTQDCCWRGARWC